MSDLPPGFELDPIPEGFTLDEPAAQPVSRRRSLLPQESVTEGLMRAPGRAARAMIQGPAGVFDMVNNAGAAVLNAPFVAYDAIRGNAPGTSEPFQYGTIGRLARRGAAALGLPDYDPSVVGQIGGALGEGGAGGGPTQILGRLFSRMLTGTPQTVARAFGDAPGIDFASGALGQAAGEGVQQAGGGEAASMGTNFAASSVSAVVMSAIVATAARRRGVPAASVDPNSLTPDEITAAAADPDVLAVARANGITEADDPRLAALSERLQARRTAEAGRVGDMVNLDETGRPRSLVPPTADPVPPRPVMAEEGGPLQPPTPAEQLPAGTGGRARGLIPVDRQGAVYAPGSLPEVAAQRARLEAEQAAAYEARRAEMERAQIERDSAAEAARLRAEGDAAVAAYEARRAEMERAQILADTEAARGAAAPSPARPSLVPGAAGMRLGFEVHRSRAWGGEPPSEPPQAPPPPRAPEPPPPPPTPPAPTAAQPPTARPAPRAAEPPPPPPSQAAPRAPEGGRPPEFTVAFRAAGYDVPTIERAMAQAAGREGAVWNELTPQQKVAALSALEGERPPPRAPEPRPEPVRTEAPRPEPVRTEPTAEPPAATPVSARAYSQGATVREMEAKVAALQAAVRQGFDARTGLRIGGPDVPADVQATASRYPNAGKARQALKVSQQALEAARGREKIARAEAEREASGQAPRIQSSYGDPKLNATASRTAPTPPMSLARYIVSRGGLRDTNGELRAAGLDRIPGLINNRKSTTLAPGQRPGLALDEADLIAREGGYRLETTGRGESEADTLSPQDALIRALQEEQSGRATYPEGEGRAYADEQDAWLRDQDAIREMGERYGLTGEEFRGIRRGDLEAFIAERTTLERARFAEGRIDDDLSDAIAAARAGADDPFIAVLDDMDSAGARGVDFDGEAGWRADEADAAAARGEAPEASGGSQAGRGAESEAGARPPSGGDADGSARRDGAAGSEGAGGRVRDAGGSKGQRAGQSDGGQLGEAVWKKNPGGSAFDPSGHTVTIGDYSFQVFRNSGPGGAGVLGNHLYVEQPSSYKPGWSGDPGIFTQGATRAELVESLRRSIDDGSAEWARAKPKVEENGQTVLPGAERSDRQAIQARAEAPNRGKVPQKGTEDFALFDPEARNQKQLFDDGARHAEGGDAPFKNQLYSGTAIFDPKVWRWMFGGAAKYAEPFRDGIRGFIDAHSSRRAERLPDNGTTPPSKTRQYAAQAQSLLNAALGGADAEMRAMADMLSPQGKSEMNAFLDRFFARSGQARGVGRTYDEGVSSETNRRLTQLGKALEPIINDEAKLLQAVRQVRSGSFGRGEIGDAARALSAWLKDMRDYQVRAGVEMGDIRRGYFPRVTDTEAVWRDREGFRKAAERAYRDSGVDAAEAKRMAQAWLDQIVTGGRASDGALPLPFEGIAASHTKGRELTGPNVDKIMEPFLISDPRQALVSYATAAVRRAEFTRSIGGAEQTEWKKVREMLTREGQGERIAQVQDYVSTIVGAKYSNNTRSAHISSWIRTATALGTLEKATLASIPEAIMPAVRSGNIVDAWGSLSTTVRDLFGAAKGDAKRLRDLAEDLGAIAGAHAGTFNAARWFGGDVTGKAQAYVLDRFFRRTGLEQWTRATRVAAVRTGDVFLNRLAKDAGGDGFWGRKARFSMLELGIPRDKMDDFTAFVRKSEMTAERLQNAKGKDAEMAALYRTAVMRFVDQSIMRPSAAVKPKWASHPFGAMAFQLNSYAWAFHENVLMRPMRVAFGRKENLGEMTAADRAMFAGMIGGMTSLMLPIGFAMVDLRDTLLGDPKKVEERKRRSANKAPWDILNNEEMALALSRSGVLGRADPLLNILTGVKYGKDVATSAFGPGLGQAFSAAQTAIEAESRNSPRTNNAERKVARAVYDMAIEPGGNYLLSALPLPVGAIATQALGHGSTKEAFVSSLAGPEMNRRRVRE